MHLGRYHFFSFSHSLSNPVSAVPSFFLLFLRMFMEVSTEQSLRLGKRLASYCFKEDSGLFRTIVWTFVFVIVFLRETFILLVVTYALCFNRVLDWFLGPVNAELLRSYFVDYDWGLPNFSDVMSVLSFLFVYLLIL